MMLHCRRILKRQIVRYILIYTCAVLLMHNALVLMRVIQEQLRVDREDVVTSTNTTQSSIQYHSFHNRTVVVNSTISVPSTVGLHRLISTVNVPVTKTSQVQPQTSTLSLQERLQLEEQERQYYKKRNEKVQSFDYDVILRPSHTCSSDVYMIIVINSNPDNVQKRNMIRETWGSVTKTQKWPSKRPFVEKFALVFILGVRPNSNVSIQKEIEEHDDIVLGSFVDSYRNMTLKSMFAMKYAIEFCRSASFLLKTDDDMIINLPYLVDILYGSNMQRGIMGSLNVGSRVYRNGKWKISKNEFPFAYYPPYYNGAAYVISAGLVKEIVEIAEYVPQLFVDDVYITGILRRILNVTVINQPGFAYWTSKPPGACDLQENRIITGTKMTPTLIRNIWNGLATHMPCK